MWTIEKSEEKLKEKEGNERREEERWTAEKTEEDQRAAKERKKRHESRGFSLRE